MKTFLRIVVVLLLIAAVGAGSFKPAKEYIRQRNLPKWRTDKVALGKIIAEVDATGEVKPELSVSIGSFVSGPIVKLPVEFNDEVKEGQLLAKVDPRIYEADVERDKAVLLTRQAEVKRVEALLQQARNDEERAIALRERNENFLSGTEMDQLKYSRMSLEAQLDIAKASVKQSQGSLANSNMNLEYTDITSPVDGIVIDRKIDPGQTLAATFQTPELFIVAPNMRENMHIHASVDEIDIGLIREAQAAGHKVIFFVDAYPEDRFEGTIEEVRFNSTTTQNVVTYPVIVSSPNPDLKLLPGMTATLWFRVGHRENVLKIPESAIRFFPNDPTHVCKKDRKLLEGRDLNEENETATISVSASERAEARRKRKERHVWIKDGDMLSAVKISTGISDGLHRELVSGDLTQGQSLVTGTERKKKDD